MLEKLKTSVFHPAATAAAAAAASAAQGRELLIDADAFDADVSIKVEKGIFLCAHPIGEVDDRPVGQLHQELCRGEFNGHLEQKQEDAGGGMLESHFPSSHNSAGSSGLTWNSSPWRKGKPPSLTSSHQLPPW